MIGRLLEATRNLADSVSGRVLRDQDVEGTLLYTTLGAPHSFDGGMPDDA